MRVDTQDLIRAFQSKGEAFEEFVHDLVRAVARSCGIDPTNVDWDYRTTVADGGRDLILRVPNPRADKQFLPARPSVWSIKSGEAGVSPASLKDEVLDRKHPKVRKALHDGWAYVWCAAHPANQDKRDEMRQAAKKVADALKVDPALFEFRWPEQLQGEVNLYPNQIGVHLPDVASPLAHILSLREWVREFELRDGWVDFGGRGDVARRVTEHLLGRQSPNVLHIAGLSGIGKSRTVFEACNREPELHGVFYVERFELVGRDLYRYLEEDGRHVYLVIDETPLHQLGAVVARLGEFANRVRVVTIGPAVRQAATNGAEIVVLPEPDTDTGVLEVVRTAGAGLSEEVLRSIAVQSAHDLRLALLLVRASQRSPEFRGVPVVNIDGVWQRLMALFGDQVGDPARFRELYEVLTVSIDVGMTEDVGGEIAVLAQLFEQPVEHVRAAADRAAACGLGLRTRRFFEATPRALAARLFETRVWGRVQDRLDAFALALLDHSDRLARRFLERCQDCTGAVREEVVARLGDFFLRALSEGDVTVLSSRPASRLFQTWAEFDPRRGLGWLRQAVERASPEELLALQGGTDGSGGWRGRRQLVWLCQNLMSFAEHLEDCEAILFRLALHETEPSIGNNSTIVWQSLFWPALAGTEVPFGQRLPILLRRLRTATAKELPLVLGAAVGCIQHRDMGLPAPPRVVGGRVVPRPWLPQTWHEFGIHRREAAVQILDNIDGLADDHLPAALAIVADDLRTFLGLGLLDHLRALFRPDRLDEPLRRRLVAELEQWVAFLRETGQKNAAEPVLQPLEEWLTEVSLTDLVGRVRQLTAQNYWSTWGQAERDACYGRLADELITSPESFRGLADWFTTPQARSADSLGFWVGRRDEDGRLAEVVREWLRADYCRAVVISYLNGTAAREGALPEPWAATLDALAANRPEPVAIATASSDVSTRGFDRLLGLLDRLPAPSSGFLRALAFGDWLRVLHAGQRTRAAEALVRLADAGDPTAAEVGLDLIQMWAHFDPSAINPGLADLALNLASRPLSDIRRRDLYTWQQVLLLLCPFYPRQVAELVMNRITEPYGSGVWGIDEGVNVLARAAAVDPSAVMEAVGNAVLDRDRRVIFGVAVFRGWFEAIGLQHVAGWLERHGREHLRWLARHFPSPHVDEAGRVVVPALTEWLFREHEADDEAFSWFLMGCHSSGVFRESNVDPARRRKQMQPFLGHELRRVREWAEYEILQEERQAEFFREMNEDDDRR